MTKNVVYSILSIILILGLVVAEVVPFKSIRRRMLDNLYLLEIFVFFLREDGFREAIRELFRHD
jgi:hypothetical protein